VCASLPPAALRLEQVNASGKSAELGPKPVMMMFVFPLLDGYRAMAALMVLTTHVAFTTAEIYVPVIGPLLGRMDFGVTLFFLLSGFLLYRPWALAAMTASTGPRLGRYSLRRAGRILPAYWVMVIFTLVVLPEIQPVSWQSWPIHLGMLHIYVPDSSLEGLTQTWSLATEVAFYLALPCIAWWAGRRHRGDPDRSTRRQFTVLITLAVIAWVFTVFRVTGWWGDALLSGYWLPGFLDWFALGMAAAIISARMSLPSPPAWMLRVRSLAWDTPTCLGIAAALFVIAATPLGGPLAFEFAGPFETLTKHAIYGVIAFFLLLPGFLGRADRESAWARLLQHPVTVYLGTISYGIFLWHLVLLRLIVEIIDYPVFSGGFWVLWTGTVVISVCAASLSWFLIERPIQRWTHVGRLRTRTALTRPDQELPAPISQQHSKP
jgi:peptidoglycan/LPS O-acetylase OafA/YrhL